MKTALTILLLSELFFSSLLDLLGHGLRRYVFCTLLSEIFAETLKTSKFQSNA